MPDVNRLRKFHNASSFMDGDIVEFVGAGEIKEVDFSKKQDGSDMQEVLQIPISINGEEPKDFTMNSTSMKNLVEAWGPKTEKWVGKQATVEHIRMFVFGEKKNVLSLEPLTSTRSKAGAEDPLPPPPLPTESEQKAWDEEK